MKGRINHKGYVLVDTTPTEGRARNGYNHPISSVQVRNYKAVQDGFLLSAYFTYKHNSKDARADAYEKAKNWVDSNPIIE